MTDAPWLGDACSLVEAFRAGDRSPLEELEATLAAIDASELNAFVHLDEERKAAMVSNLLVVLCGERGTQPIVNTGTIYS